MTAHPLRTRQLIAFCVVLAAGILAIDMLLPLGVAGGVPYVLVVLVSLWLPDRKHALAVAVGCTVLTILGFFMSPEGGILWYVLVNRGLAIFAIWVAAILGLARRRTVELEELNVALHQEVNDREAADTRFRDLLESTPDAIVIVDRAGKIVLANAQTEQLFGHERKDLIGQSIEMLIPSRYRDNHPANVERYFSSPNVRPMGRNLELYGLHKDDQEFPVEISLSPISTDGELLVAGAIRDVTYRKKIEEDLQQLNATLELRVQERTAELQETNQELTAFGYSVSHDLRAPLRAISGFSEIIAGRYRTDLNEQGQRYFDNIITASKQMGRLIDDLLGYSRLGQRGVDLQTISLAGVIQQVHTQLTPRLEETSARLTVADDLPQVLGDETLLLQIFINLLENAIRYARPGVEPEIEISWRRDDSWVTVSVCDNGIGISEEFQEKVFQIFQRLHSDAEIPGTGIGLAIVKKSVQLLGGEIALESVLGQGCTFHIKLPHTG